ncbi:Aste57867_20153 [Aphanomyces stellatus]|uniref:Aste57867_20153 protein n=1 Tax=Aphanomyces stellatus TaxID=120398 RepID=A0A485LG99_9STRA|nr:hypothetical protein As57867_020087 [Aphanomyces stellatus]VFT96848.1 Aste57867_20153 [Aphanomyces stellatus]
MFLLGRRLPRASAPLRRAASTGGDDCSRRNKGVVTLSGLDLQLGGSLSEVQVTYEQWGDQTLSDDRTVVIFPSFSHSSHAASNRDDPRPGWWENMIGPGKAINTSAFRVICPSVLGSPYGSTSPLSKDPATGKPFRASFPQITPADMANVHSKLLDHLGIHRVHAVVGGSMGGMQAVQFASLFPDRLERLVAISCTAQTTPGTVAFRRVQRLAILSDPSYKDGNYTPGEPLAGMKVARELGMTCYRSREEFDSRFDWRPSGPAHFKSVTFDVENYMEYQAAKFARIFDPNCYLVLSKAMDLTNVGHGYNNLAEGVGRIKSDSLIIGVNQDLLVPPTEQATIANILESYDVPVTLHLLNSKYGHDAMFHPQMQTVIFAPLVQKHLEKGLENLDHEQQRYSSL